MVQLQALSGQSAGKEYQSRRFPVVLGRSSQCDLAFAEPGVWDRHLTIRLDYPNGFVAEVHDQAFATINDASFQSSMLRNGDVLGLGSLKLQFGLSPTNSRSLKFREWLTWVGFGALFLGQLALIYALPG